MKYIHTKGNFSLPPGLERITAVLQRLGNPQNTFRSVHIAGTNGKGSTAVMLSSVFRCAGFKTGLFVSPYIIDFRERIQIDGQYISREDLAAYADRVAATEISLTEFEFITAAAFLYFAEKGCRLVVCETGLGGRLDATNSLEKKLVSVITKIGLDHTAILGDTLEKIAYEKCGIFKGEPAVTNPKQSPEAMRVIADKAVRLTVPDLSRLKIHSGGSFGNSYEYKGKEYRLSLCGAYQLENAVTATEAIEAASLSVPYETVYKGLLSAKIPARMEIISRNPLTVLDGAHNPDGAEVLAHELEKYGGKAVAIIGMMRDKAYEQFLKTTLKHCRFAVAVKVDGMSRSLSAEDLCEAAGKYCRTAAADNYADALLCARQTAGDDPLFIFGSLYLAADIRKILLKK